MTKQITKMAKMMFLAMAIMVSAAMAQDRFIPIGHYTGVENSEGKCELSWEMCYGNTVNLNSFGEWESSHLSVSLNYSTSSFYPNNLIVTGGTWSMVIVRDNQYAGTLFGNVQTGSLVLTTDDSGEMVSKRIRLNLAASGGLGIFSGHSYKGIIGTYDVTTNFRSKETSGYANFTF